MKSVQDHSILFYNVENLFDINDDPIVKDSDYTPRGKYKWTQERYDKKLFNLENIILSVHSKHPIVAGFTEVENRGVLEDLIDQPRMKEISYEILHRDSPDVRGIDVGLIFDNERVEYLQHEYLRIDFPWNRNIKTRDVLFFQAVIGGEEFWLIVNHWPSRRKGAKETEEKRLHVADKVREKIEQIQFDYPDSNILIMGDFNDEPTDVSITRMLKAKRDKNIRSDEFFNLCAELDNQKIGTSTHMGEWLMIDQMMINRVLLHAKEGSIVVKNNEVNVYKDKSVLHFRANGKCQPNRTYAGTKYIGGVSDHLPIYVVLDRK